MADEISGYAARYNEPTIIAGQFREKLAPGCFSRSLRERPDVVAVLDHDTGRVLGRVSAKTLWLRDDRIGLFFSLTIDDSTPSGQEARGTVGRGDVKGCSFLMSINAERWEDGGSQLPLRIIEDADLYEITLTAFPAYPTTSASLRADSARNTQNALAAARRRAEAAHRLRGIR